MFPLLQLNIYSPLQQLTHAHATAHTDPETAPRWVLVRPFTLQSTAALNMRPLVTLQNTHTHTLS